MILPSPFVYWAQDLDNVYLKVDLKDIEDEMIDIEESRLEMSAKGVGAHGQAKYSFSLDFYSRIDADDQDVYQGKITARYMEFVLKKSCKAWWPRLIRHQQKPPWLKVDFEKWKSEDDLSEDEKPRDVMDDYPELYEKLAKEEFGYIKEDMKKVYLVFYNLTQFIFFMYIMIVMGIRYMKEGDASFAGTYEAVGSVLKFAQIVQFLEIMHPLFGYTKGSCLPPLKQGLGRSIVLFTMIEAEKRMWNKPVVAYLILIWSLIELVRYPYYIAELYKKDLPLLTWLRHSIWIPLYPLGALCEGLIIYKNIPYFEETQKFVVSMPNQWNTTFHTPTAMRMYLLFVLFPGVCSLMTHLYRARQKKLGKRKINSKN